MCPLWFCTTAAEENIIANVCHAGGVSVGSLGIEHHGHVTTSSEHSSIWTRTNQDIK